MQESECHMTMDSNLVGERAIGTVKWVRGGVTCLSGVMAGFRKRGNVEESVISWVPAEEAGTAGEQLHFLLLVQN